MDTKKILTEEHKKEFRRIWDQKGSTNPFIIMGYYHYSTDYNFYGIAFDPETNVISWLDTVQGYIAFTLEELQDMKNNFEEFERVDYIKGAKLSGQWIRLDKSWDTTVWPEEDDEQKAELTEEERKIRKESMEALANKLFN